MNRIDLMHQVRVKIIDLMNNSGLKHAEAMQILTSLRNILIQTKPHAMQVEQQAAQNHFQTQLAESKNAKKRT